MNIVFMLLITMGLVTGIFTGKMQAINEAIVLSAASSVERILGLIGIFTMWLGVAKVAERSGLLQLFTRIIQPFAQIFFPSIPKGHPAMGAILMNLTANLFGFGSAATPFGLKAMEELQKLNANRESASEAMCTFLAINTSSVTLIPTTIIAVRAAAGSANPTEIVGTTLIASAAATSFALIADYWCRTFLKRRR
ncbi:MAG: nucleoside recognition domain-containing protein [Bacillota bacterium]|nr:nucleoside recognition domain-containing protein [Bacillota bacterium]